LLKNQFKKVQILTIFLLVCIPFILSIQQAKAEYLIKPGDNFKFYLEILNKPGGSNHFINYRGLFIYEEATLEVKILDVDPAIRYRLTVDRNYINTALLTNIFVQDGDWNALTLEYEALGYEVVETQTTWGIRQNDSTILNVNFNKKDGVLNDFYAFNESQLVDYLGTGEIQLIRTSEFTGLKWPYAFLAIIPLGGIVVGIVIYKRRVGIKEKMLEAT
jgi:hypothetical protein